MSDLHQLMTDFLREPTQDHFRAIRSAVIAHPAWHPYAGDIEALQALVKDSRWTDVALRFQHAMPSLMLSPEAHFIAAEAARRNGDENGSELLAFIANALLGAISASGEGTRERPYLVTNVSDEYMILLLQSKQVAAQTLDRAGDRRVDCFRCHDGGEVCFDITDMHARIGQDLHALMSDVEN